MTDTPTPRRRAQRWMVDRFDPMDKKIKDKRNFSRKSDALKYANKIGGEVYGFVSDAVLGTWVPLSRLEVQTNG